MIYLIIVILLLGLSELDLIRVNQKHIDKIFPPNREVQERSLKLYDTWRRK